MVKSFIVILVVIGKRTKTVLDFFTQRDTLLTSPQYMETTWTFAKCLKELCSACSEKLSSPHPSITIALATAPQSQGSQHHDRARRRDRRGRNVRSTPNQTTGEINDPYPNRTIIPTNAPMDSQTTTDRSQCNQRNYRTDIHLQPPEYARCRDHSG